MRTLKPLGVVKLTREELKFGAYVGKQRNQKALKQHLMNPVGQAYKLSPERQLANHILGAKGEVAFCIWMCRAFGLLDYRRDVKIFDGPSKRADFGNLEIKTTDLARGRLIIGVEKGYYPDSRDYVLVVKKGRRFEIWGAIRGKFGRKVGSLESYGGRSHVHFVSREHLQVWPIIRFVEEARIKEIL